MVAYGCRLTDDFFSFSHFTLPSLASFSLQCACITFKKIFYFAASGFSFCMRDLRCPIRTLQLQCPGLAVPPHVGSQILDQGLDPHLLTLQDGFLTTGPPGKPCLFFYLIWLAL